MKATSQRTFAGAAAGAAAASFLLMILPALAQHVGGSGPVSPELLGLIPAAAALGYLLERMLRWAGVAEHALIRRGATLPWLAVLIVPLLFVLPPGRYGMTGTPLGPAKHAFATAWVSGIFAYACFFLPPVFRGNFRRRVGLAAAFLILLLNISMATQPPNESDENDYVGTALALAHSGTTRVDKITVDRTVSNFYFGAVPPSWIAYEAALADGGVNRYSYRMIGYSGILAPFIRLAEEISMPNLRWYIAFIPGVIAFGLLAWAAAEWCGRLGERSAFAPAILLSALPLLYYSSNTQPEIWMAAGTAWAFLFCFDAFAQPRYATRACVLAALLLLLHERMIVFSAVLFCSGLMFGRGVRIRSIAWSLPVFVIVTLSFAAVLQFQIPTSSMHAYGKTDSFIQPERWLSAAIAHIFSPRLGILFLAPFTVIALVGFVRKKNAGLWPGAVAFLLYFILIVTYPDGLESWPHLRYFVPALALFFPFAIEGVTALKDTPGGRAVLLAVLGAQIVIAIPLLAVPQLWRYQMFP